MKPNPLFLLFLLLLFANCRKEINPKEIQLQYPEDPTTTTLTPRERLQGVWRLEDYLFNSTSIVGSLNTVHGGKAKIEDVQIGYDKDLSSSKDRWLFSMHCGLYFNFTNETAFTPEDPTHIQINGAANPYIAVWFATPFVYDTNNYYVTTKWKITKLFDKELNFVLETDSGDYKVLFKKD